MSEEKTTVEETQEQERTEVCFWCGKPLDLSRDSVEKGELCLIKNYDYCERCIKDQNETNGIRVIGVTEEPIVEKMPPLVKVNDEDNYCLYPTGSTFLATEEYIKELLPHIMPKDDDMSDEEYQKIIDDSLNVIFETRRALVPAAIVDDIIKQAREAQKQMDNTVD